MADDITFEAKQIVRSFSDEADRRMTRSNDHTELADVIKDEIQREEVSEPTEREIYEAYYKPRPVSDNQEVARLDVESNKLRKALEGFQAILPPEERTQLKLRADGFEQIQAAVQRIENSWKRKKKEGVFGTTKTYMNRLCSTISSHGTMLKLIPAGSEYTSILSGTIEVLLTASQNYEKVATGLSQALVTIGEAVDGCIRECRLWQTDRMKTRIMNLYAHVFLFLTDAVNWYTQKSRHRLLASFREDFYETFEKQIKNIERFSTDIKREADIAAGAQARVTGMDMEELKESIQDIRVGLVGLARAKAEDRVQIEQRQIEKSKEAEQRLQLQLEASNKLEMVSKMIGELAINQLVQQAQSRLINQQHPPADTFNLMQLGSMISLESTRSKLQETESIPQILTREAVALNSAHLEDFFDRERVRQNAEKDTYVSQPAIVSIQEFMVSTKSRVLYVVGPFERADSSMATLIAAKMIESSSRSGIPVLSYFCKLERARLSLLKTECAALVSLGYALIRQAVECLPFEISEDIDLSKERFARLDGTLDTWSEAMSLLSDVLELGPSIMVCVVDGIHWLDDQETNEPIHQLIRALRETQRPDDARIKVLLTTAGRSRALLKSLDERTEVVFAEGHPGHAPGTPGSGRKKFIAPFERQA